MEKYEDLITLGERLKTIRKQNNMTQEMLGLEINVPRSVISDWETGSRKPTNRQFNKLAELYNVSISSLNGYNDINNGNTAVFNQELIGVGNDDRELLDLSVFNELGKTVITEIYNSLTKNDMFLKR